MRCAKTFATPLALIIGLALAGEARAGILFDFNNQSDAGLTRFNPLAGVAGQPGGSFTFPLLAPGNYGYELASPGVPSALVPVIGQARLYSIDTAVSLTNFSTSADIVGWNDTLGEAFGVGGRTSNLGLGTSDGYVALYLTAGNGGNTGLLVIERITNEIATDISDVAVTLDPTQSYQISFTGVGANLSASLFDLSAPGVALATVTATDTTYTSGFSGVVASAQMGSTSAVDVTFDNLRIASVPEPSTLVLGTTAVAILALARSRCARSARRPCRLTRSSDDGSPITLPDNRSASSSCLLGRTKSVC